MYIFVTFNCKNVFIYLYNITHGIAFQRPSFRLKTAERKIFKFHYFQPTDQGVCLIFALRVRHRRSYHYNKGKQCIDIFTTKWSYVLPSTLP